MVMLAGLCLSLVKHASSLFVNRHEWLEPLPLTLVVILVVPLLSVLLMVCLLNAQRPVFIQYSSRTLGLRWGERSSGSERSHLPLYLIPADVSPILVTQGWLMLIGLAGLVLSSMASVDWLMAIGEVLTAIVDPLGYVYWLLLFGGVVLASFFVADIHFAERQSAELLRRQGATIPGVRPGRATDEYLKAISRRLTLIGGLALAALIILLPNLYYYFTGQDGYFVVFSLLLIVGIVLGLSAEVEIKLQKTYYDRFLRHGILG
jgi:preprotein translocase subunit SecY